MIDGSVERHSERVIAIIQPLHLEFQRESLTAPAEQCSWSSIVSIVDLGKPMKSHDYPVSPNLGIRRGFPLCLNVRSDYLTWGETVRASRRAVRSIKSEVIKG